MRTNTLLRVETRSISIAAPPATVLDLVGDARRLPECAPGFARAVRPDDTEPAAIATQMRTVEEELRAVQALCASGPEAETGTGAEAA